ncbi:MAG: ABC transporter ATP-binding protein [Verrucomicrobiales bacterium]
MVSVSIRHLTKRFGATVALDDVSLEIEAGEIFFLLGPSGCGKTTLLRHIAGFYQPDGGAVYFGDKDVTATPAHRRNTAMMFQSYALWPHMTVAKNVAFGLEERKVKRAEIDERVEEALEIVRMEDYAERKINQLSGGQQQRVALARALVVRPACLLLDEPLSNLDAKLRMEMRGEIRRICKEFGLTAIYVTHDQKEALSIADRMAIMEGGRLAQVGAPQDIYRNPRTAAVANFIGETNFLSAEVEGESSRAGFYNLATAFGRFRGRMADPEAGPPPRGAKVTLSCRPESFVLVSRKEDVNTLAGSVDEVTYLGELAQYIISTGSGRLRVSELNPEILRDHGDDVIAAIRGEDVVILQG